jgi:nickel-dependent lactate racemase
MVTPAGVVVPRREPHRSSGSMVISQTSPSGRLGEAEMREVVERFLAATPLAGKRVLAVIPDHTRSGPTGTWFRVLADALGGRARQIDFLIALGTHPAMEEEKINELLKLTARERESRYGGVRVFNHEWDNPGALRQIGTLSRAQVEEITSGMLSLEVPVKVNRLLFDYDHVIICGPVFPHEVVGFSGGHKYFFPGIAAPEVINFTHWVGALLTNPVVNGTRETRVRAAIEAAADLVPVERSLIGYVVEKDDVAGVFAGPVREAWKAATELSSRLHIKYIDHPYQTVLSCAPKMYDDIWTAGKCMYKMEPAVADGGTLIIYAPHIDEVSYSHGRVLDEIGYHTRDYFVKQWDRFRHYPWGVVAHSTHVRGVGAYEDGVEKPRVNVVLATRIPEARCRKINLGYMDPDAIDPADYANREDQGILMVPKAGEILYRLKDMSKFERIAAGK